MHPNTASIARLLFLAAAVAAGPGRAALAQTPAVSHDIPQYILLEHEDDIKELTDLSHRPGQLGIVAQQALDLIKRHHQREVDYILPPLSLLATIAAGKVTPDMRWAITMADKVKATREEIFLEHTAVTDAMNAILLEADKVDDKEAAEFARAAAADSLGDLEIQEPTTVLIGEYLKLKLGPAQ
jgi:DNA-binding XRE family transcriptional regulator